MRQPLFWEYGLLIAVSLLFVLVGLYLLANFNSLLKSRIRHELLRKNIIVFGIVFSLSAAIGPMNGGILYVLTRFGWAWLVGGQFLTSAAITLVVYNFTRMVAENKRLRKLGFGWHNVIVGVTLILLILSVQLPLSYCLYGPNKDYISFSIISCIYLGGAITIVYGNLKYLDAARKRKFDEKELELSRLRELKSKAELDALHSKVNPHFLYNALNSIADLSITDGRKARKMTIALADLFRYSINYSQNNYSTVHDEVDMTEVYLQIEKIRFEDQLNYTVQIQDGAGHYLLPRFLLQPLVENAVKHGLKATGKMTEIRLEVAVKDNMLEILLYDNGPAFPEEIIPGYGVKSVFDKLDLLFPDQYDIFFHNEPRKQVCIHLFKLMKNEPQVQGNSN